MRLEPDPLDPIGTGLKTGDVNPEVRDMMLLSTRLRVWNPDVVVPPSELRCHGGWLMVQSLSASHASLDRSHSPLRSFAEHCMRGRRQLPLFFLTAWRKSKKRTDAYRKSSRLRSRR